jgi:hypothetical protein
MYKFGSLELMSNSMENAEREAKKNIAASFIPEGLNAQFDVVFNAVFKDNNWWVDGTVKNNSNVAVTTFHVRPLIYVFDDKKRLLAEYPVASGGPQILNPGAEFPFETIFSDLEHRDKTFGAGLVIEPYAIPAK